MPGAGGLGAGVPRLINVLQELNRQMDSAEGEIQTWLGRIALQDVDLTVLYQAGIIGRVDPYTYPLRARPRDFNVTDPIPVLQASIRDRQGHLALLTRDIEEMRTTAVDKANMIRDVIRGITGRSIPRVRRP